MVSFFPRCKRLPVKAGACALLVLFSGAVFAKGNLIVGTTDAVTTLDPAKCYNYWCSSVVFANAGNQLLGYEPGSTKLTPELAKAMPTISDDGLTYTFKLRHGVKFQNGSKMTAKDVKFSLNRSRWIHDPQGASFLLNDIKSIETPDPYTVVIHLKRPDITFSSKIAYVEATIVPSDVYPSPDGPLPQDATPEVYKKYIREDFIGTGPYKIDNFQKSQSMLMSTWDGYWGKQPTNNKVLTRFYAKSSQLLVALKSGEIDVAFRHLTPTQQKSLKSNKHIKVIKGNGAAIRYIVFNPNIKPAGNVKVRRAIAAAINRARIVKNVQDGRATPLFSMVPPGYKANVPVFKKRYKGKKASDYIDHKVKLTLWYSRGHYGQTETALAQTIARELNETGLFDVSLDSAEWAQYVAHAWPGRTGQYAAFLLGWYPDYLDPDDYLKPFFASKNSFLRMYDNPKMDKLLHKQATASSANSPARMKTLAKIQKIVARDAPTIPLYVSDQFAYARDNIAGVAKTMGPAQQFHFAPIHRTGK